MKFIREDYLDAEEQFWDYHTKPVTGKIVFDTSTTGTGYDYFINDPKVAKSENKYATIEYMTPIEYFKKCAYIFNSRTDANSDTAASLISAVKRDKATYKHLLDILTVYKRTFPIGWLNYADMGQEGMHRMAVAGDHSGWDTEQPVLVIRWIDEKLAMNNKKEKQLREETQHLRAAISRSIEYNYSNIEEFRHQLQYELNREYNISHYEDDIEFSLESDDKNSQFIIKSGIAEDTVDYDEINFVDRADEDDIDLDSLELDFDELPDGDIDSWLNKYMSESLHGPSLAETLEKHDTLNPAIWNDTDLKDDVKEAIKEIVAKYIEDSEILSEDDIIDVELLGSNASYNYTEHSDLDVHIVVNMESISSDPTLLQIACNAERSLFNKAYNFTVKGVEIELYVEDVKAATASNGIYSLMNDSWIKMPVPRNIPDYTDDSEYLGLLDTWMVKAKMAMSGESSRDIQKFVNELYNLRRLSIMTDGEYAKGNLVFKEIRNAGILQELKDKINELTSKELSLESLKRS